MEKQVLKDFINIIYKCKYGISDSWSKEACESVFEWIDFIIKSISEINRNDKELLASIDQFWNEQCNLVILENNNNGDSNGSGSVSCGQSIGITFTQLLEINDLKEYVISLWLNNISLESELQLSIFMGIIVKNYSISNNNNIIKIFREIAFRKSFNNLLKDFNMKFQESIFGKDEINNKNQFPSLHINNNLSNRATAQLFIKRLYIMNKDEVQLKSFLLQILNSDSNIYLWIILLLSYEYNNNNNTNNSNSSNNNNNNNSNTTNNIISILLKTIECQLLNKKVKFFLNGDTSLLIAISRLNFEFHSMYHEYCFSLVDHYLFNEKAGRQSMDPVYLENTKNNLIQLSNLEINGNYCYGDSGKKISVLNSINQRILATKINKTNELSIPTVLGMLVDIKDNFK